MSTSIPPEWDVPEQCEYEGCEEKPIVGVNKHHVCKEHMQWVFDTYVPNPRKLLEELARGR